jgi:putative ABC transport system permease protein
MRFAILILKNVWRQRTRTLLTIVGISIGIATILALGAVSDGLKQAFAGLAQGANADLIIAEANTSEITLSTIDESLLEEIRAMPEVSAADGALIGLAPVETTPYFLVWGVERDSMVISTASILEGRLFDRGAPEIMLGKVAADAIDASMGDRISLLGHEFEVVGAYETGSVLQDGGAMAPLSVLQEVQKAEGKVTLVNVRVSDGTDVAALAKRIDLEYEDRLVTIKSVDEISRADQGIALIDGAAWMISALAVVVGGIGVMNTMIISVYDRTREIGVLRAIGWRRRSIVRMVLAEAVLVGTASVLVATPLAIAATEAAASTPAVEAFLEPAYSLGLWIRATIVALLVTLAGGAYPAYRAASLSPVQALRYE